jgi:hypothetical protein
MKKLLLSLAITAASVSANAYQMEAGVGYADNDFGDTTSAFFDYHFEDVDTSKGPLNEANFLSKSSHVGVQYVTHDFVDTIGVEGRFVFDSDWTLGVNYANVQPDFGDDVAAYGVTLGKYVSDHSEVYLGFADTDSDYSESVVTLGYKSVVNNFGYDTAIATSDGEYAFNFDGMYYFTKSFGLGAGLVYDSVSEDTNFTVAASYFFTEGVELEVGYEDELETTSASLNFRF